MPETTANGLMIHYDTHGDPADPAMLLVMGLGAQMTLWPVELVEALVARGFHVIRYDNRDVGLSQKFHGLRPPGVVRAMLMKRLGLTPRVPYSLADMASDGIGLLDALEIERAHVVGASMGGMIVQHMGFSHPERVASLTSIMSTTGHAKLPPAEKEAMRVLLKRPDTDDENVVVAHGMRIARTIGSPAYPYDEEQLKMRVTRDFHRSYYPEGVGRQMAAIIADGCRRDRLAAVSAPTLVVHGEDDPLVKVACGHDTAAHIPGANLKLFPGMGHNLPLDLVEPMADVIAGHARQAVAG
ncbi:MAG: alpha/beta fold hydrolase [Sphingomonadaceae bacterium]|nr:alpha/beta fold hydrolase [Sphingomonadaceae bacterium]